jgi:hypothetical protein
MSKRTTRRDFIKKSSLAAISITPAIKVLSQVAGVPEPATASLISAGFRLTQWESLLNLEFYFINTEYRKRFLFFNKRKLVMKYSQEESYMIVRLPQQHIAERSTDGIPGVTAVTRISGYSYLVFRIVFPAGTKARRIKLTARNLMAWDNSKRFRLVVRQNLNQSLFEITTRGQSGPETENIYPFGFRKTGNAWSYNPDSFPKAYGDPITALEFPWRIILSPKLPDQDRFRFSWEFSRPASEQDSITSAELWRATLSVEQLADERNSGTSSNKKTDKGSLDKNAGQELNEAINQLDLMLLGSPDYPAQKEEADTPFLAAAAGQTGKILPDALHRKKLVELYIRYKLAARSEKIHFSPLGVSTFIQLKNTRIEETRALNDLFGWKHLISLGRDQQVEIITLTVDVEFGHKWLHLFTTKRRTKKGISFLDYREYIMPLETEKDYSSHVNRTQGGTFVSKFNAPFTNVKVLDASPREILSLANQGEYKLTIGDGSAYVPVTKKTYEDASHNTRNEPLEISYDATDWQGNKVSLSKKLQLVELKVFENINRSTDSAARQAHIDSIGNLFSGNNAIGGFETALAAFENGWKSLKETLANKVSNLHAEQLSRYKSLIVQEKFYPGVAANLPVINDEISALAQGLVSAFATFGIAPPQDILDKIDAVKKHVASKTSALVAVDIFESGLEQLFSDLESAINGHVDVSAKLRPKFDELAFSLIRSGDSTGNGATIRDAVIAQVRDAYATIRKLRKEIPNLIQVSGQHIGFAVPDMREQSDKIIRDEVSRLQAEFLVFKGELKRSEDTTLDFFDPYASVPQLVQARVFVNSLNKLVNDEVPVTIRYAKDYVAKQVDLATLDAQTNTSRVFAEVFPSSQEYLKGVMRKASLEMGGFVNPELPVEYLTYLKDPRKLKESLLAQIPSEVSQTYNDLVFLGKEAKNTWELAQQITPADFFHGLEAKILGSIRLADILGIDSELPRLSQLPDKITYTFVTDKINSRDFDAFRFSSRGNTAQLKIYLEKSLRDPRAYTSFTSLANFALVIGDGLLTVVFDKMEVFSSSDSARRVDIKIRNVAFGGPLDFLGKLAEAIKMPGSGLRVNTSISNVSVGYTFAMPSIESPVFNFSNLKFDIGVDIPLPTLGTLQPLTTSFSVNSAQDKFLITVGIFGGRGHFVLRSTPTAITHIDAGIEFGGYLGINLGIASGHVFLFAGIRYVRSEGSIYLAAYLICGGGVTVFGFISVSLTFLMMLEYQLYQGKASLYGTATLTYSIKIAFFKISFSLSYSKRLAGAEGKKVNPDGIAYQSEINHPNHLYASTEDAIFSVADNVDQKKSEPELIIKDAKTFASIYDQKEWRLYCESFKS